MLKWLRSACASSWAVFCSAACTRAPVPPPPPPDGLADYGTARNLLECVPTCESSSLLSLKLQSVQHTRLIVYRQCRYVVL